MSKTKAVSAADLARIPDDAARLLEHVRNEAQHDRRGIRVVVSPRPLLARKLGMTPRQLARAEDHLLSRKKITVDRLLPRNEFEAARPPLFLYRIAERSAA